MTILTPLVKSAVELVGNIAKTNPPGNSPGRIRKFERSLNLSEEDQLTIKNLTDQYTGIHEKIILINEQILQQLQNEDLSFTTLSELKQELIVLSDCLQSTHLSNFITNINKNDVLLNDSMLIINLMIPVVNKYKTDLEIYLYKLEEINKSVENSKDLDDLHHKTEELLKVFNIKEPTKDRSLVDYLGTNNLRNNVILKFGEVFTRILQAKMDTNGAASSGPSSPTISRSAVSSSHRMDTASDNAQELYDKYVEIISNYKEKIIDIYNKSVFSPYSAWYPSEYLVLVEDTNARKASLVGKQYARDFVGNMIPEKFTLSVLKPAMDGEEIIIEQNVSVAEDQLSVVTTADQIQEFLINSGLDLADALQAQLLLTQTVLIAPGTISGALGLALAPGGELENVKVEMSELKSLEHSIQFITGQDGAVQAIHIKIQCEIPVKDRSVNPAEQFAKFITEETIVLEASKDNTYLPSQQLSTFTYSFEYAPQQ